MAHMAFCSAISQTADPAGPIEMIRKDIEKYTSTWGQVLNLEFIYCENETLSGLRLACSFST